MQQKLIHTKNLLMFLDGKSQYHQDSNFPFINSNKNMNRIFFFSETEQTDPKIDLDPTLDHYKYTRIAKKIFFTKKQADTRKVESPQLVPKTQKYSSTIKVASYCFRINK